MLNISITKQVAFADAVLRPQTNEEERPDRAVRLRNAFAAMLQVTGLLAVVSLTMLLVVLAVPALRDAFVPAVARTAAPVVAEIAREGGAASPVVPAPAAPGLKIGEPVALAAADERVAHYLARRYHIADGAVRVLVAEARSVGARYRVDPLLILSVMAVESSLNPYAQSAVGAVGLMQVLPSAHPAEFHAGSQAESQAGSQANFRAQDIRQAELDPIQNVRAGTAILADAIRRGGSVLRGLQLYVGAGNLPDDGGYASHVLAEMAHLELAAQGRIDEALIDAHRADRRV